MQIRTLKCKILISSVIEVELSKVIILIKFSCHKPNKKKFLMTFNHLQRAHYRVTMCVYLHMARQAQVKHTPWKDLTPKSYITKIQTVSLTPQEFFQEQLSLYKTKSEDVKLSLAKPSVQKYLHLKYTVRLSKIYFGLVIRNFK